MGKGSSTSVMARRRAKDDNEGLTEEERLWKSLDLFCTPPWGSRAVAEKIRQIDPSAKIIREPACGLGHFAGPLAEYFPKVISTDVYPHGFGDVRDWLDPDAWRGRPDCDWVITNPPFTIADQFVTIGLERARRGVALLLRVAFLEGAERHAILDGGDASLTLLTTFSERLPMTLGKWRPEASSATAYACFIWMKGRAPMPPQWFPPGTRDRLWKPDDARIYGWAPPAPLLDLMGQGGGATPAPPPPTAFSGRSGDESTQLTREAACESTITERADFSRLGGIDA